MKRERNGLRKGLKKALVEPCGFIAINEDVMENHILDRHARPDEQGEYKCDDCDFKSSEKESFGKHFTIELFLLNVCYKFF